MPERQTHYQLSFTTRQAMILFVSLLAALGLAYFLGLMTGLAGKEPGRETASSTPTTSPPTPAERIAAAPERPTPVRPLRTPTGAVPAFPKPVLGVRPTASALQFFEDRAEVPPTSATSRPAAPPTPARPAPTSASAEGEFWVQVFSMSSQQEAQARRDKLARRDYRARVESAQGPKGTVYRVRVGPFTRREEAEQVAQRLSIEEKVQTWIAPAGK